MASVNKVILIGNLGQGPGDPVHPARRAHRQLLPRHERELDGQERPEAGAHRVAPGRGLRQDRPGRPRLLLQGQAGLHRGQHPVRRVDRQGRQQAQHDQDPRERAAARGSCSSAAAARAAAGALGRRRRRPRAAPEGGPRRTAATTSRPPTTTFRSRHRVFTRTAHHPREGSLPWPCGGRTSSPSLAPPGHLPSLIAWSALPARASHRHARASPDSSPDAVERTMVRMAPCSRSSGSCLRTATSRRT